MTRRKKQIKAAQPKTAQKLTDRQEKFLNEYLIDLNATRAAIAAGYSKDTARNIASETLAKPYIQERLAELRAELAKKAGVTPEMVIARLKEWAFTDPNEIVEHRRGCCRYCYGEGHRYQRTAREQELRRLEWDNIVAEKFAEDPDSAPEFDIEGGIGYDPRKDPHPDCPECFGMGVEDVFIKDTRKLAPGARSLYAGVKQTRQGIEIKLHDQQAALDKICRHLGMYVEKHEISGPEGGPIETSVASEEAYARLLNGG